MSTEIDLLLALRQAIKSRTTITYSNDSGPCSSLLNATQLVLSGKPFPKAGRTRYQKPDTPSEFYLLDALYVAWLLREAPGAEYMKQLREHGLSAGFVSVTERKHVTDWLEGKISDNERIAPLSCEIHSFISLLQTYNCLAESTTPPGTPRTTTTGQAIPATPRTRATEANTSSPSKRRYVADTQDVEVVKKIRQNEVELRDRNSVLRGIKPNVRGCIRPWNHCR
jgi:parafibromin